MGSHYCSDNRNYATISDEFVKIGTKVTDTARAQLNVMEVQCADTPSRAEWEV